MEISGIVKEVERYSIHDGPGIRTVVFLKGCPIRCRWCCNPETFKPRIEMAYYKDLCLHCFHCINDCPYGAISNDSKNGVLTDWSICQQKCFGITESFPCTQHCYSGARKNMGQRMTIEAVVHEVAKDQQLYDRTDGGVTLSGGEISTQPVFVSHLLRAFKEHWIDTAIETNGFGSSSFYRSIAADLDFVFMDIKTISDVKHRSWTGASNAQVINSAILLSYLSMENGFDFVIRTPIIPGFNDSLEDVGEIAHFVSTNLPGVSGMELLPYHKLGRGKYESIGLHYTLEGLEPPGIEKMYELEQVVTQSGLEVIHY